MKKKSATLFCLLTALLSQSCTTRSSSGLANQANSIFALASIPFVAFDKPGPYGNWWMKEPLEDEKDVFTRALNGPLSPKDQAKEGSFVGWFGVLLECKPLTSEKSRLLLDHRFASDLNLQFGPRDSQSIHTISLFGDGLFSADINKPCSLTALNGDLLRVYGTLSLNDKQPVVVAEKTRYWPRSTYELTPRRAQRDSAGAVIRRNKWPDLTFDPSVPNRETAVDEQVLNSLQTRIADNNPGIRARAIYSIGELGKRAESVLLIAREKEKDPEVRKSIDFALRRARGEIGPFWNINSPEPYWKNKR